MAFVPQMLGGMRTPLGTLTAVFRFPVGMVRRSPYQAWDEQLTLVSCRMCANSYGLVVLFPGEACIARLACAGKGL